MNIFRHNEPVFKRLYFGIIPGEPLPDWMTICPGHTAAQGQNDDVPCFEIAKQDKMVVFCIFGN